MFCAASARPVLTADPRRSRSRDEGVECGSASSRVRRARSRRGIFPGIAVELARRFAGFEVLRALAFFATADRGGAFLLAFLAGTLFLADACGLTVRFAARRVAKRRAAAGFRADFPDFLPLAAFRLAMD